MAQGHCGHPASLGHPSYHKFTPILVVAHELVVRIITNGFSELKIVGNKILRVYLIRASLFTFQR